MASARYWRLIGCKPYGYKGDLSLSEIALYAGASRVDTGLTCPYSPASGSLSNLSDASTSTVCTFSAANLSKSNFELRWDLGSAQEVTSLVVGSADTKGKFLAEALLQASTDGVVWLTVSRMQGVDYPGANALATVANFKALDPTFLARFDGTNGAQTIANAYGSTPTFTFSTGVALSTAQKYAGSASMSFPGTDKFLYSSVQPHAASFNGSSQQSMSAWVYYDATAYIADNMVVGGSWETYSSSTLQEGWYLEVGTTGRLHLSLHFNNSFPAGPSVFLQSAADKLVPLQTWTHVAWERIGDKFWLYLNGEVVASTTVAGAPTFQGIATKNFGIGCINTNPVNAPWKGHIDEYMLISNAGIYGGMPFTPGAWVDQTGHSPSAYTGAADAEMNVDVDRDILLFSSPTTNTQVKAKVADLPRRDMLLGGNGVINGTVKEKSTPTNVPLYRRVRLIEQRSGYTVAETWSNATTGNYSFANIDRSLKYTVVSYDHTGLYRAVIADNLTPDLMT